MIVNHGQNNSLQILFTHTLPWTLLGNAWQEFGQSKFVLQLIDPPLTDFISFLDSFFPKLSGSFIFQKFKMINMLTLFKGFQHSPFSLAKRNSS